MEMGEKYDIHKAQSGYYYALADELEILGVPFHLNSTELWCSGK